MTGELRADPRFPALDGIRAIAAFAVVCTHVGFNSGRSLDDGPFAPLLARLDFGVTLFFLLSGFVIYRPFVVAALNGRARPAGSNRRYLTRRAVRILPAYWVAVLVTLAVLSLRHPTGHDWWAYPLLLQTYTGGNLDPSLTQMWTLSVELSFYLLVPVAAGWAADRAAGRAAIVRRNLTLIGSMIALAVVAGALAHTVPAIGTRSLVWLPANVDWFALGMLLALISACAGRPAATAASSDADSDAAADAAADSEAAALPGWQPPFFTTFRTLARATGVCWALAGLIFWFATLPLAGPRLLLVPTGWEGFFKHSLYGLCALLLLAPLTLAPPGRLAAALSWRPIRYLGEISYGVYLWHLPLLLAIQDRLGYATFSGHFWVLLALTVLSTVLVASLSWRLLEQPLMRRVSSRYRDPSPPAVPASAVPASAGPASAETATASSANSTNH
ncbi:MAG: acyltransferase [Jatrophihabitantaceae bacterium]